MFLVNETGPTMLTLEDENQKKFKIKIGSEITCSCNQFLSSAEEPYCIHTVFALNKIFRIDVEDPMIWQVSYLDTEIAKILENRDNAIVNDMNKYSVYA